MLLSGSVGHQGVVEALSRVGVLVFQSVLRAVGSHLLLRVLRQVSSGLVHGGGDFLHHELLLDEVGEPAALPYQRVDAHESLSVL